MKAFRRWISAALTLVLAVSLAIPSAFAAFPAEPFADFRIDAVQIDVADSTIGIGIYRPDESGTVQQMEGSSFDCKINRVTGDASFYIQPKAEGVYVTIDYLTNANGDDFYELTEGDALAQDSLNAQGNLVQGGGEALTLGQTYILSAETLAKRFDEAERSMAQRLGAEASVQSWPLCRVTLSRVDPADGQNYEQLYFLELFEGALLPGDVLRGAWWYDAVTYCLGRGWLTGRAGDGMFAPEEPLTRAQLAQVLWTMAGCPESGEADFLDVLPEAWFYQAVSWCRQEGLIAGYADGSFLPDAPLTREQLASFLHRYAKLAGMDRSNPYHSSGLSHYGDYGELSPWAADSMDWAMEHKLFLIADGLLRPGQSVTRAELAGALYALKDSQAPLSMW